MSTPSTSVDLDNTIGALFIGVVVAMGLWGVSSVQMYYYFIQYPKDAWWLKVLVMLGWVLDTAHQGLVTQTCYVYLVSHRGNPTFLHVIVPTLMVMVLLSAIVCLLVQTFLVYRAWKLSNRNLLITVPLLALTAAQFITTTIFFDKGIHMSSFADVLSISWPSKISNSLAAATDICIAITLIFLLHRCRTGFKRSEAIINRLILFTINSGALTSIFALFVVFFNSIYPDALIYLAFYICISRLYINTLFASLNVRNVTREGFEVSNDQFSTRIVSWRYTEHEPRAANWSQDNHIPTVHTETEVMHGVDDTVVDDLENGGTKLTVDPPLIHESAHDKSEHNYSNDSKAYFVAV